MFSDSVKGLFAFVNTAVKQAYSSGHLRSTHNSDFPVKALQKCMEILDVKIQYSLILMSFISKSEPMSPSQADTKQKFLFVCSFVCFL